LHTPLLPLQLALSERAHHLSQLLSRLHWQEQHFACCLSPSLAAMMMQVGLTEMQAICIFHLKTFARHPNGACL